MTKPSFKNTRFILGLSLLMAFCPRLFCADSDHEDSLTKRQKVQLLSFFAKPPGEADLPSTNISVSLYNQAADYFQRQEYDLARQTVEEAIKQDQTNAFAYELLGEIDNRQERLKAAKENYEIAYNLQPSPQLKSKIEKLGQESKVERKLASYEEEHFIIRYANTGKTVEGFELREMLRGTYSAISKDFAYYFNHQVAVLLYNEEDYKKLTNLPHWAAGLYDGKVRMPLKSHGFLDRDLKALTAHEVTHAFIAAMSRGRAPAWINEGLAQYEENKIKRIDPVYFNAAVKTGELMPLVQLTDEEDLASVKDSVQVGLFYQESFRLVQYLVDRYKMFYLKQMLAKFGEGKTSPEVIQEVLKISLDHLEKEWKNSFGK